MRATLVTAIMAALVSTVAASAEELRPIEAKSISLGDVSGIAYYTVQPDGYEVVATLAAETATPVRFVATLMPGQRVTLSVPAGPGAPEVRVDISRVGDHLEFGPGAQVAVIN